jgi:hypothetical protein
MPFCAVAVEAMNEACAQVERAIRLLFNLEVTSNGRCGVLKEKKKRKKRKEKKRKKKKKKEKRSLFVPLLWPVLYFL